MRFFKVSERIVLILKIGLAYCSMQVPFQLKPSTGQSNLQVQRLFTNIMLEMKSNGNLKFPPSRLWQFEWWGLHNPSWIIETGMQLEDCTLYHYTKILICCTTNINSPFMRLEPNQNWQTQIEHVFETNRRQTQKCMRLNFTKQWQTQMGIFLNR